VADGMDSVRMVRERIVADNEGRFEVINENPSHLVVDLKLKLIGAAIEYNVQGFIAGRNVR